MSPGGATWFRALVRQSIHDKFAQDEDDREEITNYPCRAIIAPAHSLGAPGGFDPVSSDWNTAANWIPATVNTKIDTATLGTKSNQLNSW